MSSLNQTIPPYVFEQKGTFPAPYTFDVPGSLEVRPDTATARFDGTNASGDFLACLTFYGTDGERLCRMFNPTPVKQGAVAEVTFIPPFGSAAASAAAGGVDVTDGTTTVNPATELLIGTGLTLTNPSGSIAEVTSSAPVQFVSLNTFPGGALPITSVLPGTPDLIVTAPAIIADGLTTYRIEFSCAAVVVDQRGINNQLALLFELWIDGVASGVMADTNGPALALTEIPCLVLTYDKPSAGSHVYELQGYLVVPGGGTAGTAELLSSISTTPHATRTGSFVITTV